MTDKLILDNGNTINILWEDATPLYCKNDIVEAIGISRNSQIIMDQHKQIRRVPTSTNNKSSQLMVYLTHIGVCKILQRTRKNVPMTLLNHFNINEHRFTCLETDFISNIRKAFFDYEVVEQYPVNGYLIDLYFPRERLAIEFDETRHKYTEDDDKIRQTNIENSLNCIFIRAKEDDNIFDTVYRIRRCLDNIKKEHKVDHAKPKPKRHSCELQFRYDNKSFPIKTLWCFNYPPLFRANDIGNFVSSNPESYLEFLDDTEYIMIRTEEGQELYLNPNGIFTLFSILKSFNSERYLDDPIMCQFFSWIIDEIPKVSESNFNKLIEAISNK